MSSFQTLERKISFARSEALRLEEQVALLVQENTNAVGHCVRPDCSNNLNTKRTDAKLDGLPALSDAVFLKANSLCRGDVVLKEGPLLLVAHAPDVNLKFLRLPTDTERRKNKSLFAHRHADFAIRRMDAFLAATPEIRQQVRRIGEEAAGAKNDKKCESSSLLQQLAIFCASQRSCEDVAADVLYKASLAFETYGYSWCNVPPKTETFRTVYEALYQIGSKIRHSCWPNTLFCEPHKPGGQAHWIMIAGGHAAPSGSLSASRIPVEELVTSRATRQALLHKHLRPLRDSFCECSCIRCKVAQEISRAVPCPRCMTSSRDSCGLLPDAVAFARTQCLRYEKKGKRARTVCPRPSPSPTSTTPSEWRCKDCGFASKNDHMHRVLGTLMVNGCLAADLEPTLERIVNQQRWEIPLEAGDMGRPYTALDLQNVLCLSLGPQHWLSIKIRTVTVIQALQIYNGPEGQQQPPMKHLEVADQLERLWESVYCFCVSTEAVLGSSSACSTACINTKTAIILREPASLFASAMAELTKQKVFKIDKGAENVCEQIQTVAVRWARRTQFLEMHLNGAENNVEVD